jgi:hypothetical protein
MSKPTKSCPHNDKERFILPSSKIIMTTFRYLLQRLNFDKKKFIFNTYEKNHLKIPVNCRHIIRKCKNEYIQIEFRRD